MTFSALLADGEELVRQFDRRGFAVGSGSACTSSTLEPSHVLAAMGALTHGNVRITLPLAAASPDRAATVAAFCAVLPDVVAEVRAQLSAGGRRDGYAAPSRCLGLGPSPKLPSEPVVDARGLRCPLPILRLAQALTGQSPGRPSLSSRPIPPLAPTWLRSLGCGASRCLRRSNAVTTRHTGF